MKTQDELIKGCIEGDRLCQNKLYENYFNMMSSIAIRYCNNESDVHSNINYAFLKVLKRLHTYDHKWSLATWIRTIVVNHLIDGDRKKKRQKLDITGNIADYENKQYTLNQGASNLEAEELRTLLSKLPKMTNKVFNMFAIDGYKHHEIATALGMSEGTSKWHVNQARKLLTSWIEELEIEEKKRFEFSLIG